MKNLLNLLLLLGSVNIVAQAGPSQVSLEAHTLRLQPKEIITKFFENITNSNFEEAFMLVSDDVQWWVPGDLPFSGMKSKNEYRQIAEQISKGFPTGFSLKETSMIANGNVIAVEAVSNGTHVNNKKYNNFYHFLFEIKDGKIIKVKEYMDTLHLYKLINDESKLVSFSNEEVMGIYAKNLEKINKLWIELGEETTLREATLAWLKNGMN